MQDSGFEKFVGILLYTWQRQFSGVSVSDVQSRGGLDEGRDFEISVTSSSSEDIRLFGKQLVEGNTYFVEAKSIGRVSQSRGRRLDFQRGASNLSKSIGSCHGFFFFTNAHAAPNDQLNFQNICKLHQELEFFDVIDGELLLEFANQLEVSPPKELLFGGPLQDKRANNHDGVITIPHVSKVRGSSGEILKVVVGVFNRRLTPLIGDLYFINDEDWIGVEMGSKDNGLGPFSKTINDHQDHIQKQVILGPQSSIALVWYLKPINRMVISAQSGSSEFRAIRSALRLRSDEKIYNVLDKYEKFDLTFLPPFVGESHEASLEKLGDWVSHILARSLEPNLPRVALLVGETGVGKSRIIDELYTTHIVGTEARLVRFTIPDSLRKISKKQLDVVSSQLNEFIGHETKYASMVDLLAALFGEHSNSHGTPTFIVLEDFHNAEESLLKFFLLLEQRYISAAPNIWFILSTRDDGTYHNREFDHFLGKMLVPIANNFVSKYKVEKLSKADSHKLIKYIFDDISERSVERIHKLSSGIPIRTIQIIEHLLDGTIIEITSRGTVSIVNLEVFGIGSDQLPNTIESLYMLRIENLVRVDKNYSAIKVILLASLFGSYLPTNLTQNLTLNDDTLALLENWGYLKRSSSNSIIEWSHETLFLFFRNLLNRWLVSPSSTPKFCSFYPEVASAALDAGHTLDQMQKGCLLSVAGRHTEARTAWAELYDHASSIDTFQTIDTQSIWYDCIDFAILSAFDKASTDQTVVTNLILLKVFIGTYFRSHAACEAAFISGQGWLDNDAYETAAMTKTKEWLNQLRAHSLLDAGHSASALAHLLPINMKIQLNRNLQDDHDFSYNVHNCLRMAFNFLNFFELGLLHSEIANRSCENLNIKHVLGSCLGDEAVLYYFVDPERSRAILRKSIHILTSCENQQHLLHSQVSLIGAELPGRYRARDSDWILNKESWVAEKLTAALSQGYNSITPRMFLILAALQFYLGVEDCDSEAMNAPSDIEMLKQANRTVQNGIEACEAHSVGYISWQLYNLQAAIAHRMNNQMRCLNSINRAVKQIEAEGLLLLGNGKVCSAVPIVLASAVNVYSNYASSAEINQMLAKVRGFNKINWAEPTMKRRCIDEAKSYGTLFTDELTRIPDNAPFIRDVSSDIGIVTWC